MQQLSLGSASHSSFSLRAAWLVHVLTIALGVVLLVPGTVQAQDWYVDDDTCPNTGSGTSGDPYCSIQTAVDNATAGDVISVAAGTYDEEVNVVTSVTLNGPYAGTNFDGQSSDRGGEAIVQPPSGFTAAFHIGAADVTIDGFLVDGQETAFYGINNFDTGQSRFETVTNFTIQNNIVKNTTAYGVFVCNGTDQLGVNRCGSDTELGMTTGGTVSNNRFEDIDGTTNGNGDGFGFDFAGRAISMETDGIIETITNNVIVTSPAPAVAGQSQYGIQTGNHGDPGASDASGLTITISGNTIDVEDRAIWANQHFDNGPGTTISGNVATATEALRVQSMRSNTGRITVSGGNSFTSDAVSSTASGGGTLPGNAVVVRSSTGPIEFIGNTIQATDGDATSGEDIDGVQIDFGSVVDRLDRVTFNTVEGNAVVVSGDDPNTGGTDESSTLSAFTGYDDTFDFSNRLRSDRQMSTRAEPQRTSPATGGAVTMPVPSRGRREAASTTRRS
jgi:hypothetical protein